MPLEVRAPAAVARAIGQAVPYPGATNTISVTFAANVDLVGADGSNITVAGLSEAASPDDEALALTDLDLWVARGTLARADEASPTTTFFLPASASNVSGVYAGFKITVTTAGTSDERYIDTYSAEREVVLTAALSTDATNTSVFVIVAPASSALDTSADWSGTAGTVTLRVTPGRTLRAGILYGFSFQLMNPASEVLADAVAPTVAFSGTHNSSEQAMHEDTSALLASFNTTLTASLAATSPHTRCLCASAASCCSLYAEIQVDSTSGMKVESAIRVNGELMTVMEVHGSTILWVTRGPAARAHAVGDAVTVLRAGPALGTTLGILSLSGGTFTSSATSFVFSGILPSAGSLLRLDDEFVVATAVSPSAGGGTVTVSRAQAGSSAATHADGTAVILRVGFGCVSEGDAAPLRVLAPSFIVRDIGQATPYPTANNTVTITLASSVALAEADGSVVTISGLTGSQTPDSNTLALTDVDSTDSTTLFGTTADWDQDTGTLLLSVASGQTLAAGSIYKFSIALVNPDGAQDAPAVTVSASGTVAVPGALMNADRVSRPNVLKASRGDAAPLQVNAPGLSLREISQSRASPDTLVTVTVTLASNVDLFPGDKITIAGLNGTQTADAAALGLQGLRVVIDAGYAVALSAPNSELLLPSAPARDQILEGCDITVYTNASATIPAETVPIDIYLGQVAQLGTDLNRAAENHSTYIVQSNFQTVFGATAAWTQATGALVLTVASGRTMYANVTYAFAFEVTTPANAQDAPAATVAVSGSRSIAPATMTQGAGAVLNVTIYNPGAGYSGDPRLVASAGTCYCAGEPASGRAADHCFVPQVARDSQMTFERAVGAVVRAVRAKGGTLAARMPQGATAERDMIPDLTTVPEFPGAVPPPVRGDAAPMQIAGAQFIVRNIGQSIPYPGATNTITVTIATNVLVTDDAVVSISGLTGGDASPGIMKLAGADAGEFTNTPGGAAGVAEWDNVGKTATLFVRRNLTEFQRYTFSFQVRNPDLGQPSPAVVISAIRVTGGRYSPGVSLDRLAMNKDETTLLAGLKGVAVGDAAPLAVQNPVFLEKRIGQSSPWPCNACGIANLLTVTLSLNIVMSSIRDSRITITGLTGTQTADTGGTTLLLSDLTADVEDDQLTLDEASSSFTSREGVRLMLQGAVLVDEWYSTATRQDATALLRADALYDLTLEYKELTGQARIQLLWSRENLDGIFSVVPSDSLYYNALPAGGPWPLVACGDGKVRVGLEGCDDGNAQDNDGCSAECQIESGWACAPISPDEPGTPFGAQTVCQTICGDGRRIGAQLGGTEECDDKNTAEGDGCSSACVVEEGYSCVGGSTNSRDVCRVLTPAFSAANGSTHTGGILLTITTGTELATVIYTLDGSDPTSENSNVVRYGPPGTSRAVVAVSDDATVVRAFATRSDLANSSAVARTLFVATGGAILFDPPAGPVGAGVSVSLYHAYQVGPIAMSPDLATAPAVAGGAAGDAAPLLVFAPGFTVARIAQSSTTPGAINILTVQIAFSSPISGAAGAAALVLSGLLGVQTASTGADLTTILPLSPRAATVPVLSAVLLGAGTGDYIVLGKSAERELARVVAVAGDSVAVQRAQARTKAFSHEEGGTVEVVEMTTLNGGLAASGSEFVVSDADAAGIELFGFVRIGTEILYVTDVTLDMPVCTPGCSPTAGFVCACAPSQLDLVAVLRAQGLTSASAHENEVTITKEPFYGISTAVTADATTFQVQYLGSQPEGSYIAIDAEIMLVTSWTFGFPTVLRAQAGSQATAHTQFSAVRPAAQTVLSAAVSESDTEVVVDAPVAAGVRTGCLVQVGAEIMSVSAVSRGTLTVARAQESTIAANHSAGSYLLALRRTTLDNAGQLAAASTTATVASVDRACIAANDFVQIGGEIIQVTAIAGNVLTLTRGLAGTDAVAHADGRTVTVLDVTITSAAADKASTAMSLAAGGATALGISAGTLLLVGDEILRVDSVIDDALTITRAVAGTAAEDHADGARVSRVAGTTLDGLHTAGAASLSVVFTPDIPALRVGDHLQVGDEVVKVTGISGDSIGVLREQGSSVAASHADGTAVVKISSARLVHGTDMGASDTTCTVASATAVGAAAGSLLQIDSEVMLVSAVSGNTLTVQRGYAGTTATMHRDGSPARVPVHTATTSALIASVYDTTLLISSAGALGVTTSSFLMIEDEILGVSNVNGNNLTVVRSALQSGAASHSVGARVMLYASTSVRMGRIGLATQYLSYRDSFMRVLSASTPLLQAGMHVRISEEIVRLEAAHPTIATTFTVARGVAGTLAATHPDGAAVTFVRMTTLAQNAYVARTDTTLILRDANAVLVPAGGGVYVLVGGNEIVRVESASLAGAANHSCIVLRGRAGSAAARHKDGSGVELVRFTVLAASATADATSIDVEDVERGEVAVGSYVEIDDEVVKVTALAGDTLTVDRAQAGTAAAVHAAGAPAVVVRRSVVNVGESISADETELKVHSAAAGALVPGSSASLNNEVVTVAAADGDTLIVTRGQAGTSAASHAAGSAIAAVIAVSDAPGGGNLTAYVGTAASWTNAAGRLTLSFVSAAYIPSGLLYTFSFPLRNPTNPQDAQTVLIESPAGGIGATGVQTDAGAALATPGARSGDTAPLVVRATTFTIKEMGQATPNPGERNTLTVTLAVNVELPAGTRVSFTGLTGSTRTSTNSLPIQDSNGAGTATIFGGSGVWFRNAGTLTLEVAAGQTMAAETAYAFAFELTNPTVAQAARAVFIAAVGPGVSIALAAVTHDPACLPSRGSTVLVSAVAPGSAPTLHLQNATAAGIVAMRHVRVDDEIMLVTYVAGNSVSVRRAQRGTVAVCHEAGAVTHTILLGSGDGDCRPLRVHAPAFVVADMVQNLHWVDAVNTLTLNLASNTALHQSAGTVVTLTGLTDTQTADTTQLNLTDASETGGAALFGGSGVWTQRSGTLILTLASNQTLLPDTPYQLSFQVRNYNPPQLPKSPGLGRLSPDVFVSARGTVAIPLTAVASDAQLLPCESTTSITDTGGVSATAAAITIDNPSSTYKGRILDIDGELLEVASVTGSTVAVLRGRRSREAHAHLEGATVCVVAAGAKAGYARPLEVYKHGLVVAVMGQSNPFPGATNTLSVTLATSFRLTGNDGVRITLRGLLNTQTTSAPTITEEGTTIFGNGPQWNQGAGTFEISINAGFSIEPGVPKLFSFPVTNPAAPQAALQAPPSLSYQVQANPGSGGVLFADTITPGEDEAPAGFAGLAGSDARPLRVLAPAFLLREIAQATPYPSAANTVDVTLAASVPLDASNGAALTLAGLTGTQTGDSATLSITARGGSAADTLFGGSGAWEQASGTLVLTLAAGQAAPAGTLIAFSFALINAGVQRDAATAVVSGTGLAAAQMRAARHAPFSAASALAADLSICGAGAQQAALASSASAAGIAAGVHIQVGEELLLVTAVADDDAALTVQRGALGTAVAPHRAGAPARRVVPGAALGDAAPLRVQGPAWFARSVGQSSPYPGAANRISVTLGANVAIAYAGVSRLVVAGLGGSATADDSALPLYGSDAAVFGGTGAWDQSAGTLTLTVASGQSVTPGAFYTVSFDLVNPSAAQDARNVTLSSDGASSSATVYYTTDGSAPTSSSEAFSSPISISAYTQLLATAQYAGQALGAVQNATYAD